MDFFREHIVGSFIFILIIFSCILGILVMHFNSVTKSRKEISEANHQIKKAKWQAAHDSLTGLHNRVIFQEICNKLKDSSVPVALLIVDVDNFKSINDNYGHRMGDKALTKVAKLLTKSFRPEDHVIRYAGDEFVIIMLNITSEDSEKISDRINSINTALTDTSDNLPKLSISVGGAFSESGYHDDLFLRADKALYDVKENGRSGCAFSKTS
jgi:diguanylate cyclase (GGDEF)-like protein